MSSIILLALIIFFLFAVIKSADYFVEGAASLSLHLGISAFIVGLTIIAMGTSAPELAVNSIAAFKHSTGLVMGNILGSNLADVLLGLGISAFFVKLKVHSKVVWREFPFMILSTFLLLVLSADTIFKFGVNKNYLDLADALVLLSLFAIFLYYTFFSTKKEEVSEPQFSLSKSIFITIGSVIALMISAKFLVDYAVDFAKLVGMSDTLIGLTIIAVGTSLPEIVTAISAARKGLVDLVVGGIIGTVIFNILLILGVSSAIHPVKIDYGILNDELLQFLVSILLFLFMFVGKKHTLTKTGGAVFVLIYVLYLVAAIIRG